MCSKNYSCFIILLNTKLLIFMIYNDGIIKTLDNTIFFHNF